MTSSPSATNLSSRRACPAVRDITMRFVHTQPHPPDKWLPQTRTADLDANGKSLKGYASFDGGGHEFAWRLVEPRIAEEKELPK